MNAYLSDCAAFRLLAGGEISPICFQLPIPANLLHDYSLPDSISQVIYSL
jgi:hypothetical protein